MTDLIKLYNLFTRIKNRMVRESWDTADIQAFKTIHNQAVNNQKIIEQYKKLKSASELNDAVQALSELDKLIFTKGNNFDRYA